MTGSRRGEARTVLRNASSTYAHRLLLGLSVLLLTPYLFRGLGLEGFGTWSVMFTLAALAGLVEWAFTSGVARLVAESRGNERAADAQLLIGEAATALALPGLVCAAALALGELLAPGLAADGHGAGFTSGMFLLGAATFLRFPCAAWAAALVGYQRWDLFALCRALETLLFAVGAIIAVETGGGPTAVAAAFATALAAGALMQGVCARRVDTQLCLMPRMRDRTSRRHAMRVSSWVLLTDTMRFAGHQFDPVLIAALRGAAAAGPFAAAHKLQSALQSLTLPLIHLLMPMVAELHASGRHDDVRRRLVLSTRVSLQLTLPVAAGLALFSADAVETWLGAGAPAVTASIVTVLMVAQVFSLVSYPAEQVLVGVGRMRALGMLGVIEGTLNVTLTIALVIQIGALGAAFGTLAASALLTPLRLPLACRATELPLTALLGKGVLPALITAAPAITVMAVISTAMAPGAPRLALGLAAGLLVAAATAVAQVGTVRMRAALAMVVARTDQATA